MNYECTQSDSLFQTYLKAYLFFDSPNFWVPESTKWAMAIFLKKTDLFCCSHEEQNLSNNHSDDSGEKMIIADLMTWQEDVKRTPGGWNRTLSCGRIDATLRNECKSKLEAKPKLHSYSHTIRIAFGPSSSILLWYFPIVLYVTFSSAIQFTLSV